MRLVKLEKDSGGETVINTDHVCCVYEENTNVYVSLACGKIIETKFTDLDHAVDYLQRASSHSFVN